MKIYKNIRTGDLSIVLEKGEDISVAIIKDNGKKSYNRYVCHIADIKSDKLLIYPSNENILDNTEDVLCELRELEIPRKKRKEYKRRVKQDE
ncbi:MAG: hypothetical protein RBS91_09495 [Sulfurimonadaceae bacterium]|jgi:hypothetical protein|nr:hypothetical protein [Sulfurimonadaceae bacterium]